MMDMHSQGEILAPPKPAGFFAVIFPGAGTRPMSQRWGERNGQSRSQRWDGAGPRCFSGRTALPSAGRGVGSGLFSGERRADPIPISMWCQLLSIAAINHFVNIFCFIT